MEKREKIQITKIKNEREDIITDAIETKNHKKLLWTMIHKQIGQPRRNWWIPRSTHLPR